MNETTFLFIDAGYLKPLFNETVGEVFGSDYTIDFERVKALLQARRAFYYDCLDDAKRRDESDDQFQIRLESQKRDLESIEDLEGYHVRLGHLTSGRNRRQKEVDVRLAVDMMTNSFNRNMSRAVLIAGDRDFRPVIEAVALAGTYVQVIYHKQNGSRDLGRAADLVTYLDISQLCDWAFVDRGEDRSDHFPISQEDISFPNASLLREGVTRGGAKDTVQILNDHYRGLYAVSVRPDRKGSKQYFFRDPDILNRFAEKLLGGVDWNS